MSQTLEIISLENSMLKGLITNYGARLISLQFKDFKGSWKELTAGYDSLDQYRLKNNYYGAICGRYANRIANGKFLLKDQEYQLDINHHSHHLHGGREGFQNEQWEIKSSNTSKVELQLISPEGHMNYPAEVVFRITYELLDQSLKLCYSAIPNKDTIINVAPHFYFNLGNESTIYHHDLLIHSNQITEVNNEAIPTGNIISIQNSSLDFSQLKKIGEGFPSNDHFISMFGGYDHNFVLRNDRNLTHPVAQLQSSDSGICMKIYTSQPGLQLYTSNWGDRIETLRKHRNYPQHSFVCLESQHFPDSPNHIHFPSTHILADQEYYHYTHYEFSNF